MRTFCTCTMRFPALYVLSNPSGSILSTIPVPLYARDLLTSRPFHYKKILCNYVKCAAHPLTPWPSPPAPRPRSWSVDCNSNKDSEQKVIPLSSDERIAVAAICITRLKSSPPWMVITPKKLVLPVDTEEQELLFFSFPCSLLFHPFFPVYFSFSIATVLTTTTRPAEDVPMKRGIN